MLACASALVRTPAGVSKALRWITAGLLALVALAHAALYASTMADPIGWLIDAALLAAALLLALTTLARRAPLGHG